MNLTVGTFELLERGANSEIFLSKGPMGDYNLVLKTVDEMHIKEGEHLRNEYDMLCHLDNSYIIKPLGFRQKLLIANTNKNVMILPFAKHKSLLKYVKSTKLQVAQVRFMFSQIVSGVGYLHDNNIVHRDIKLQNVLVFEQGAKIIPKLSDFGFAQRCLNGDQPRLFNSYKGTRRGYMAPQIHAVFQNNQCHKGYDGKKSDIFALGVMLFCMIFKKLPFQFATKQNNIYRYISAQNYDKFFNCHAKSIIRKELDDKYLMIEELKQLLSVMLSVNPSQRPDCQEVLSHPWMKGEMKQLAL